MAAQFDVTPEDLTAAGSVLQGGASSLSSAGTSLSAASAITQPGFSSAAALRACASAWATALSAAGTHVGSLGSDLNATAARYSDTEASLTRLDSAQSIFIDPSGQAVSS